MTVLFILLAVWGTGFGGPQVTACKVTGEGNSGTAVKIWTATLSTIYNIFPIRIGGVKIGGWGELEDYSSVSSSPVCTCSDPFPRVGIKVSLWEPIAYIEATKIPSCFPSLGLVLPLPSSQGVMGFGARDRGGEDQANHQTFQVHYIKFPVFAVLGLFLDFICLSKGGLDIAYFTEVDPLWQSDVWAAILNPEALLVANPVAQMSCMADAAASNLGFPLDFMWWCLGSWGSLYPFTKSFAQGSSLEAFMGVSARMVAKMHRQLLLWGSVGEAGLCGMYPMPVMRKSQYSLQPVHPVPHPYRIPIGRSSLLWGQGKDVPLLNHDVYVNVLYRKRDCCAF
ncbi:MAG: TraU family protein [Aquificota bacterium]|nr:TraU family protein [Aquificota bacterium]